jgi:pseudaminic acid synthase
LKAMTSGVTVVEKALGTVGYGASEAESGNVVFQRSLFAVEDISAGDKLTPQNVRVIRPGDGLEPRYYDDVIGRSAASDIKRGTPLSWFLVAN